MILMVNQPKMNSFKYFKQVLSNCLVSVQVKWTSSQEYGMLQESPEAFGSKFE
jgi:hypothetical protein